MGKTINCLFIISICHLFTITNAATSSSANDCEDKINKHKPGLSIAQEDAWVLMIGRWLGSQPIRGGGKRDWIVTRLPNGAYEIVFRVYDSDGNYEESIEIGEWGVAGPIYFSIFKGRVIDGELHGVDPTDPYNRDAYKIISITDEEFVYESFSSGNRFTIKKVANDYMF